MRERKKKDLAEVLRGFRNGIDKENLTLLI